MSRRILFVTQQLPWPKDSGGNIRTYHMVAALARQHEVVLCSTTNGSEQARQGERHLKGLCAEVHLVPDQKQMSSAGQAKGVLKSLFTGKPAVLEHNGNPALAAKVAEVLAKGSLDSVHLNHLDTVPYVNFDTAPPVVVDSHNLLFDYYERRAEMESGRLRKWVCKREAQLLRSYEPATFGRAQSVVVCSETERARLHEIDAKLSVQVVPNGVDCASIRPGANPEGLDSRELVFVGDLAYGPNSDAAMFFIHEVLPLVQLVEPRAKFLAVGKNPSDELVALGAEREDLIVTGFVDDVAEWVQRAELYVVPIRYGSGTRLKVLEAFAFGKPTVSTTIGAEGIDYSEGVDILIRDEPQSIADAILELFRDPVKARRLARAARQTVELQYDWEQIGERLADVHDGIASKGQGSH
jgi:sugar transferase (PEP-CTERM/EpsH1 system associated)